MKGFFDKFLYDYRAQYNSGTTLDNRPLANRSVYRMPPQQSHWKPGWKELSPAPLEGAVMAAWQAGRPLGTQAGAVDRNALIADIYLKEVQ
jgi:hypothetical protein